MIVDGKVIASEIFREVKNHISHLGIRPHLTVFTCAPNFETRKYLSLKCKKAHEVGIGINVIEFPENITTEDVVTSVRHAQMQTDGMIVQLPFPKHIDIEAVLSAIPSTYDVDAMHFDGTNTEILPPVVGAIQEIAQRHDVLFAAQSVVIVGRGRLVGVPAYVWCQKQGAQVQVLTKESENIKEAIEKAHILILGAGQPHIVQPDMIQDGVIIFDAGTSEDGGVLKGDADPACVAKATLLTPVPGGIGPITIAILLRNLVTLTAGQ